MEAIRLQRAVEKDGEIFLTGLPYKKGQFVEMILLSDGSTTPNRARLTARQLLQSDLIGLWEDRDDIEDSSAYARQLREQAQILEMLFMKRKVLGRYIVADPNICHGKPTFRGTRIYVLEYIKV